MKQLMGVDCPICKTNHSEDLAQTERHSGKQIIKALDDVLQCQTYMSVPTSGTRTEIVVPLFPLNSISNRVKTHLMHISKIEELNRINVNSCKKNDRIPQLYYIIT